MWLSPQHKSGQRGLLRNYRPVLSILGVVLITLFVWADVRADISVKDAGVIAKEASVRVVIGDSVRVPLVGLRPSGLAPVKFRITTPPEKGTLSAIIPDPADTSRASVIYTPKPNAEAGTDRFGFNAKLEGQNASPSAIVRIRLETAVARVSVNQVLPFGKVELGASRKLPLNISNNGTKTFATTLRLDPPWSIAAGQEELVVEPNTSQEVSLTFTPESLKPIRFPLDLQPGNPEATVELSGAGAAPFARQYGTLELLWDPVGGERKAAFRLANLTDRELPLRLRAPEGVKVEKLVVLAAREAVNLPVSVGGIERFRGKISIESTHFKDAMEIEADPAPAKLMVVKPSERLFNFEVMDTDTPPVYEIVVTNVGGKTAFVYGETSRPFYVSEGSDPTELRSGAKMSIKVSMDPREVGSYKRTLSILGTANKIEFQLTALVTRNVDRTLVGINLPDIAPMISANEKKLFSILPSYTKRIRGISNRPRVTNREIPTVRNIYLEEQKKRKLVFSWDHPGSADLNYLLEYEVYDKPEGGLPQPIWYRATKHVEVEKDDTGARMTLKKLQPNRQFRFRILTVDKNGHTSIPSHPELVYTLPRTGKPLKVLIPLLFVAGAGGFYLWKRRQED